MCSAFYVFFGDRRTEVYFNKSNIILIVLIIALAGMDAAALPPRPSSKTARSSRANIIDGQEFISVHDFAKHLGADAEVSDGNASIRFRKGELTITVGALCVAFREGESVRIAQINHPAVSIGNDIFIPKKSALEAVSRISNLSVVESDDVKPVAKPEQSNLIVNDLNDDKSSITVHSEGEFYTPAINDIDRRPAGNPDVLEPSMKKEISNSDARAIKSRNELDEIIREVGVIKSENGIGDNENESLIELEDMGVRRDEKLIDLSEPTRDEGGPQIQPQGDFIAPRVDEVKSLFQRGIRAINDLKMDAPETEEPHTTPSNPQLLDGGSSDAPEEPATKPAKAKKVEEKPQPPNVYKLPTNLLRKNIKK